MATGGLMLHWMHGWMIHLAYLWMDDSSRLSMEIMEVLWLSLKLAYIETCL